jgi:formylglycine-generating enzyme
MAAFSISETGSRSPASRGPARRTPGAESCTSKSVGWQSVTRSKRSLLGAAHWRPGNAGVSCAIASLPMCAPVSAHRRRGVNPVGSEYFHNTRSIGGIFRIMCATVHRALQITGVGALFAACAQIGGLGDLTFVEPSNHGGSAGAAAVTDAGGDAGNAGSPGSVGSGGDGASGGAAGVGGTAGTGDGCPGTLTSCPVTSGGPTMVLVDKCFCIDSTEVTRDQYATWLGTSPVDTGQPPQCSWNTGVDAFNPTCEWPPATKGNHPVACVDWCDAHAYCKGVGKRLCGKIGGGANGFDDYAAATESQWYNACSSGGTDTYPYGSTYQEQTCNGHDHGVGVTVAVGSLSGCESSVTGYTGVYDLSGNLWEWEDSCDTNTGNSDICRIRGGSFDLNGDELRCDHGNDSYGYTAVSDLGFRCCAP